MSFSHSSEVLYKLVKSHVSCTGTSLRRRIFLSIIGKSISICNRKNKDVMRREMLTVPYIDCSIKTELL